MKNPLIIPMLVLSTLGSLSGSLLGADKIISEVSAYYSIPINPGANCISIPLRPAFVFRDSITAFTSNSITFTNLPNFTSNAYAAADGFSQYILMVQKDLLRADTATNNIIGDWWAITGNTSNTITVNIGTNNLTNYLAVGDILEVRKLMTFKDVFGPGTNCFLYKDPTGDQNLAVADNIRYIQGTGFSTLIFYYNGPDSPEGYYVDGNGPYDGSTIALLPNQCLEYFRKTNAASSNLTFRGIAQTTKLTHTLPVGNNVSGMVFPANMPLINTFLKESGWIIDPDGSQSSGTSDVIRHVVQTSFYESISLYSGELLDPPLTWVPTWLVDGNVSNYFPLLPGHGYSFMLKTGTGPRIWRQSVPFDHAPTNYLPELHISGPTFSGTNVSLTILNGDSTNSYSLYSRTNMTNGTWSLLATGTTGQTNFTVAKTSADPVFYIAFSNQDSDGDGLSDGYELTVSRSNRYSADTDGDGLSDGWEVANGLDPLVDDSLVGSTTRIYTYNSLSRVTGVSGAASTSVDYDTEANVLNAH